MSRCKGHRYRLTIMPIIVSIGSALFVIIPVLISTDCGDYSLGFVVSLLHCDYFSAFSTIGVIDWIVAMSVFSILVVPIMTFEGGSRSLVMSLGVGNHISMFID